MNSYINGSWGPEEKEEFSVQHCEDFAVTILCLEKKFKVSKWDCVDYAGFDVKKLFSFLLQIFLNGLLYAYYQHRVSYETISDIEIAGDVEATSILYETDKV